MSQAYREAGVDLEAGAAAVASMAEAVTATYTPAVLSQVGNFGGLFDASALSHYRHPVLVASTDGVGTKVKVAAALDRWDTVGQDLVHHCINDILVQGAMPLFFLDFLGCDKLDPARAAALVGGVAAACKEHRCPLLGGETAEMGDVYRPNQFELVGTIVGAVDRESILDGSTIEVGDQLLAWPSSGLHTNGYTLARRVLSELDWKSDHPALGQSPGEAMLAVHRCYLPHFWQLEGLPVKGLAHITGGGIPGNLSRILPKGLGAWVDLKEFEAPPIFSFLKEQGRLTHQDMVASFNLGVGMIVLVAAGLADEVVKRIPESVPIGEVVSGSEIEVR